MQMRGRSQWSEPECVGRGADADRLELNLLGTAVRDFVDATTPVLSPRGFRVCHTGMLGECLTCA